MAGDSLRHDMAECSDLYESVSAEMLAITQRHFSVSGAPQSNYNSSHFNNAMLMGGVFNYYASGASNAVRKAQHDMADLACMLSNMDIPDEEWVRRVFAGMDTGSSLAVFDEEVRRTLAVLRNAGLDLKKWDLAVDFHMIPRYDKEKKPYMVKSKSKAGTRYFERYITMQVIVPGMRLVLATLPVPSAGEKGEFVAMLLDRLRSLEIADIGTVMMDREFFAVRVLQACESMGVRYLMPCRNTSAVMNAIEEFAEGGRDRISEMYMTGDGGRIGYTAIITRRRTSKNRGGKDDDLDVFDQHDGEPPHETYIAFATNDPTIDVEEYARRWGIETGYRQIEAARPRTRSENQEARTFCFMYATMMYNAWVVLNALKAVRDPVRFEKWDGSPEITQMEMKICILLFIWFSQKNGWPPCEPKNHDGRAGFIKPEKPPAG